MLSQCFLLLLYPVFIMSTIFINRVSKPRQLLLVVFIIGLVSGICLLFSSFLGHHVVAYILLVTVSVIAMFFDIVPVLLAALLSAVIWDFFFIPPYFTFFIGSAEDTFLLAMYFVVALINATLTYKLRQMEKEAREKEETLKTLNFYNILLNSLSHELKTPIATVIGAADNLLDEGAKISEQSRKELITEISIAATRLNQQVENLLNMSRLEAGYIQPRKDWCDVNELIYSVVNSLEDYLKSHRLNVEISSKLPLFKLDFGLMQEVLRNLVSNAILYTKPGSFITISASCTSEIKGHFVMTNKNIRSRRDAVNKILVLDVADNGPGFPENEIENVFQKFYRIKNSVTGGTGLGLSIAKGFVEAQNGTLTLSNRTEGGAKFTIRIPAETSDFIESEK